MPPSPIAAPELSPALQWANAEPQALAAGAGSLWIANSGAHEVLRLDLASGKLTRLPIGE